MGYDRQFRACSPGQIETFLFIVERFTRQHLFRFSPELGSGSEKVKEKNKEVLRYLLVSWNENHVRFQTDCAKVWVNVISV